MRTLAFLLALVLVGCGKSASVSTPEPVARPVKMITVGAGSTAQSLQLPGSVSAVREAVIAFEVPGRISDVSVLEGEVVTEGQELARLDPRDYESSRDSALATRNAARADYERYVKARESNAVTDQDVDLAKRALDVAQADLNSALKAVEDTILVAPFSGRVANKYVQNFENVQAKQAIFEIHDESSLEITVSVSERDWARGTKDQSPEEATRLLNPLVRFAALPDLEIPAAAKSFATAIDPVTRTYEATFSFDPPADANVSPGMTANLVVSPATNDSPSEEAVLSLPAGAVFGDDDGTSSVWIVGEDSKVEKREVSVDILLGDLIVIKDGITSGDVVVISGVHTLTEGTPVRKLQSSN